jgi:RNA polymerase sigma factor (TIGR02999 family)
MSSRPTLRALSGRQDVPMMEATAHAEYVVAAGSRPADALFMTLYTELHRLARRELRRRGSLAALGVTTLLHEAYLSISGRQGTEFVDHARFMGYAARVMRGLIIDDVRRQHSEKRGGLFHITSLDADHAGRIATPAELISVNDALDDLADVEPDLAEIIELKFFCGFSFAEIGAMRGVSERTIQRKWEKGRLYLHHAMASTPLAPDDDAAADA